MIKEFDNNIPEKYVFIVWFDQVNNFVLRKYVGNDKSSFPKPAFLELLEFL